MMRAIAMLNNKGGCGKTTSTFHISGELAKRGRKVLVVDCDKQGDSTKMLLAEEESQYDETSYTLLDLILERQPFEAVVKKNYIKEGNKKPRHVGIDVIPASPELEDQQKYFPIIKEKDLKELFLNTDYDYIIFDCPPSNQMMESLVLEQWATHVVIPMSCDLASITGMGALINKIDKAREKNPDLKIAGFFYSMFIGFRRKHKMYHDIMQRKFPQFFIKESIPFHAQVVESMEDEGRPLAFYRKSKACANVENVTSEILKRL